VSQDPDIDARLDEEDAAAEPEPARATARPAQRPAQAAPARPGFTAAFRAAYHRADVRDDLRHLRQIFLSRGFLAAVALVLVGGAAWYAYPVFTGSAFLWQLLVLPGSAFGPQLVAGFFAPRGSYLMGFVLGALQPLVYVLVNFSPRVQGAYQTIASGLIPETPPDQLFIALMSSILSGTLFAAAAAWYRRFLALSSPRRPQPARQASGRSAAKPNPSRRPGR
jgi:hypothetical protein